MSEGGSKSNNDNGNKISLPSMSNSSDMQKIMNMPISPYTQFHQQGDDQPTSFNQLPPIYRVENQDFPFLPSHQSNESLSSSHEQNPFQQPTHQSHMTHTANITNRSKRKPTNIDHNQSQSTAIDPNTGQPIKKRTRTSRSCDSCRSRKIRCDFVPNTDPSICRHCLHNNLPCTSNLPISETRFKRRQSNQNTNNGNKVKLPPIRDQLALPPPSDARMLGPTSISYLVHSEAEFTKSRKLKAIDDHYHQSSSVKIDSDKGYIHQLQHPLNLPEPSIKQLELRRCDFPIDKETQKSLLKIYFTEIAPIFPILTESEYNTNPLPLFTKACCTMAATGRSISSQVLNTCRQSFNNALSGDTLMRSSITTIQALLIASLNTDSHSTSLGSSGSAIWLRSGTAIRMAQDLALHKETPNATPEENNKRRRIWAMVVIMDRWAACAHGLPMTINLIDCDVLLPSPHPDDQTTLTGDVEINRPYLYLIEMVKGSVFLGRILQTLYCAVGLRLVNEEQIYELSNEVDLWRDELPDDLKFKGINSNVQAGTLQLSYVTLCLLLYRPMMRGASNDQDASEISKCELKENKWIGLFEASSEVLDWIHHNDKIVDHWFNIVYCICSNALIQHHHWAKYKDERALTGLNKAVDVLEYWQLGGGDDSSITWRNKLTDIVKVLRRIATESLTAQNGIYDNDETRSSSSSSTGLRIKRNPFQVRLQGSSKSELLSPVSPNSLAGKTDVTFSPLTMTSMPEDYQQHQFSQRSYANLFNRNVDMIQSFASEPVDTDNTNYESTFYSSLIDDSTPHHAFFDLNAWDVLMDQFGQPIQYCHDQQTQK